MKKIVESQLEFYRNEKQKTIEAIIPYSDSITSESLLANKELYAKIDVLIIHITTLEDVLSAFDSETNNNSL